MADESEQFSMGVLVGFVVTVLFSTFTLLWFGQDFLTRDVMYFAIIACIFLLLVAWLGVVKVRAMKKKVRISREYIGYGERRN